MCDILHAREYNAMSVACLCWTHHPVCPTDRKRYPEHLSTVEGMNFASKKIETMLHWGLDFCIFLHIFTYYYIFFRGFFVFLSIFWCKIDRVMDGGRLRRPRLLTINFIWRNPKIYTKTDKNMKIHIKIYKKYKNI